MKSWLLLGGVALALSLGGCATGNVEDDQFFSRGWLNPKELDSFGQTPQTRPKTPRGMKMDPLVD